VHLCWELSANKYLNYVEILRKYFEITGCNGKEMLNFFDEYYVKGEQKIDFLDIFTHLKVAYYVKKNKRNAFFSIHEYAYLKNLNKKYTIDLDGKGIIVEKSSKEVLCDMIKKYDKTFINYMILGNTTAFTAELLNDRLDMTFLKAVPMFQIFLIPYSLFVIRLEKSTAYVPYNMKKFECNPD